jgi:creatinine amidohydrolase
MPSTTSKTTYRLEDLTWQEFRGLVPRKIDTVMLPVGTVEAHGVTPLGTDNLIPVTISERISGDLKAMVAPLVPYGITRTLLAYPGSLTVTSSTFENYLTEVLDSLAEKGFRKIVIMNGHGGQIDELRRAAQKIHQVRKIKIVVVHWWLLCSEVTKEVFGQIGGHAGIDETACVLAANPSLVRKQEYNKKLAYTMQEGIQAVPAPGTILLYKEGEGYPEFDEKKANLYLDRVCEKVKTVLQDIFKKWEQVDFQ